MPETNILAYYELSSITAIKSFKTLAPASNAVFHLKKVYIIGHGSKKLPELPDDLKPES